MMKKIIFILFVLSTLCFSQEDSRAGEYKHVEQFNIARAGTIQIGIVYNSYQEEFDTDLLKNRTNYNTKTLFIEKGFSLLSLGYSIGQTDGEFFDAIDSNNKYKIEGPEHSLFYLHGRSRYLYWKLGYSMTREDPQFDSEAINVSQANHFEGSFGIVSDSLWGARYNRTTGGEYDLENKDTGVITKTSMYSSSEIMLFKEFNFSDNFILGVSASRLNYWDEDDKDAIEFVSAKGSAYLSLRLMNFDIIAKYFEERSEEIEEFDDSQIYSKNLTFAMRLNL